MRKIINGKIYDTETAEEIARTCADVLSASDFNFWRETLYLTKKGQYFLHGEGHALTKYATQRGNGSGWGETIILMNSAEVLKWFEFRMIDDEIVKQHFEIQEG